MRIDILTVVPELLTSPLNESILHRAQVDNSGFEVWNKKARKLKTK